jgi:hypothetical protein
MLSRPPASLAFNDAMTICLRSSPENAAVPSTCPRCTLEQVGRHRVAGPLPSRPGRLTASGARPGRPSLRLLPYRVAWAIAASRSPDHTDGQTTPVKSANTLALGHSPRSRNRLRRRARTCWHSCGPLSPNAEPPGPCRADGCVDCRRRARRGQHPVALWAMAPTGGRPRRRRIGYENGGSHNRLPPWSAAAR